MARRSLLVAAAAAILAAGAVGALQLSGDGGEPVAQAAPAARQSGALVAALVPEHPDGPTRGALDHRLGHFGLVAPDWARVRADGLFDYTVLDPSTTGLRARGALLVPVVHDPEGVIGEVLADPVRTNRLALRLAAALKTVDGDGVILDVDEVPPSGREALPQLVRTLRKLLGEDATIIVSVPAAAALGSATGYDLRDLSRPALVLVDAYGEHGPDTAPGAVASLEWFRSVVRVTQAQAYPLLSEADRQGEDGAALQLGGDAAWVETDRSVELKLKVARAAQVAGIALELGGGESTHLWEAPVVAPGTEAVG